MKGGYFSRFVLCLTVFDAVMFLSPVTVYSQALPAPQGEETQSNEQRERGDGCFSAMLKYFPSAASSYWENDLGGLQSINSEFGYSVGGKIEFRYRRLWLRGTYETARYEFENEGIEEYYLIGFYLGISTRITISTEGIAAIGYREIGVQRDYKKTFELDNSELSSTEPVFALIGRTNSAKTGVIFNAEFAFCLGSLASLAQDYYEHSGVAFVLDAGYRFRAIPLSITIGGEVLTYQLDYREKEAEGPSFAEIFKEPKIDATYGATLKVSYVQEW